MENQIISISQLVNRIKNLLENEIGPVLVKGEISNFSSSSAGHYYFTLSDSDSSISVALFRADALRNPLIKNVKDGDQIICQGSIGVYAKRGTFQIIARKVVPAGTGELLLKLEQLKQKLMQEGLLDPARKRPIPTLPKKVAIITAPQGAALQDFLEIYRRRSLWMNIVVIPALVQGNDAPISLIKALKQAQQLKDIDVIVLARGGGSLEDLWAFNSEPLAYVISESLIPVISAVGHQVDISISDLVADFRAETPSAAAEMLTAGQVVLRERINRTERFLFNWIREVRDRLSLRLERGHPRKLLQKLQQQVISYNKKLERLNIIDRHYHFLPIHHFHLRMEELIRRLTQSLEQKMLRTTLLCEGQNERLKALNPSNVLHRGYSFMRHNDGSVIGDKVSYDKLLNDELFVINFHDGIGKGKKSG